MAKKVSNQLNEDSQKFPNKTIEQLEGEYWGDYPDDSTSLIGKCYQLRRKSLKDFSIEDMRLLINQEIGIKYLMPIAVQQLKLNVLAEGDLFAGDLLSAVISYDSQYWEENVDVSKSLVTLISENLPKIKSEIKGGLQEQVFERYYQLKNIIGPS